MKCPRPLNYNERKTAFPRVSFCSYMGKGFKVDKKRLEGTMVFVHIQVLGYNSGI